jgi:3-hydroxyacyl-CoA dehydrogenase
MRVGILGSGLMGGKLGTIFARAGHEVIFSYARSEQKLKTLAREAKGNAKPVTTRGAAQRRLGGLRHEERRREPRHSVGAEHLFARKMRECCIVKHPLV